MEKAPRSAIGEKLSAAPEENITKETNIREREREKKNRKSQKKKKQRHEEQDKKESKTTTNLK